MEVSAGDPPPRCQNSREIMRPWLTHGDLTGLFGAAAVEEDPTPLELRSDTKRTTQRLGRRDVGSAGEERRPWQPCRNTDRAHQSSPLELRLARQSSRSESHQSTCH